MALTLQQQTDLARRWVEDLFVAPNATAGFNHAQILSAIQTIDADLDANVNTLGMPAAQSLLNGLGGLFATTPMATATAAQKSLIFSYVLLKRFGVL